MTACYHATSIFFSKAILHACGYPSPPNIFHLKFALVLSFYLCLVSFVCPLSVVLPLAFLLYFQHTVIMQQIYSVVTSFVFFHLMDSIYPSHCNPLGSSLALLSSFPNCCPCSGLVNTSDHICSLDNILLPYFLDPLYP